MSESILHSVHARLGRRLERREQRRAERSGGADGIPPPPAFVTLAKDILRFLSIVYKESRRDMIPLRATSLTYATLLTLIPILIIVFNLFQLFGANEWFESTVRPFILNNLAPGTGDIVADRVQEIIVNAGGFILNGIGVVLLVIAVWSIFSGIEGTVNYIWGTRSQAGSLKRVPLYWGLITIVPLLLVGSLALSTYVQTVPFISEAVGQIGVFEQVVNRTVTAGMIVIGLFLLYQFVPNTFVRVRYSLAAAVFSGLLYEILKTGFIFYTTNLVQYNVIYGSLAAILLLFIWVNLSWILVLAGVEMTFVAQHYKTLESKSKRVKLSKTQRNALGYLLLFEATEAFRSLAGRDGKVNIVRWADQWDLPPGLVELTVEKLQHGGLIERVGTPPDEILLARSPKQITVAEIDNLLLSEMTSEWDWPGAHPWRWLRNWMDRRQRASLRATEVHTLEDLVEEMEGSLPATDGAGDTRSPAAPSAGERSTRSP